MLWITISVTFPLFWGFSGQMPKTMNWCFWYSLGSLQCSFFIIMVSYIFTIIAIQRIHWAEGRCKTFSMCASHVTTVTLFYGSVTFSYTQTRSQYSLEQDKVSTMYYTVVIPKLNPLIYSLRNKGMKDATKWSIGRETPLDSILPMVLLT